MIVQLARQGLEDSAIQGRALERVSRMGRAPERVFQFFIQLLTCIMFGFFSKRLRRYRLPACKTFRRRPALELLEFRRLLAADGLVLSASHQVLVSESTTLRSDIKLTAESLPRNSEPLTWVDINPGLGTGLEGELAAEGEPADDLVAFAKALAATSTVLYGANWSADSSLQKRLFEDGGKYLPFVDVTNPDHSPNETALQENITVYPTWIFPDGSRLQGFQELGTISSRSGVAIPQSSVPYLSAISNVSVGIGSPIHQPIDAYSPTGVPLTVTVTSSNPSVISASVLNSNRSMQIRTDFGDMLFQLFEDKAPRPTSRVIELAESNFYDGLTFHRVIDGFMFQGGDPDGDGTGGSQLGNFDDQFHVDLQHNRSGVLSFAKAGDDTNNSQFFITAGPTRHLDFNHSIFGQLVEGNSVREAISQTDTGTNDRPTHPVVMREVTILDDPENAVVFLKPTGSGTGASTITVTVSDGLGNESIRTFVATVIQDTANGGPFLNEIPVMQATSGVPLNYTLTSQDVEGDPVLYAFATLGEVPYELDVHPTTGVITFTAPDEFVGRLEFLVGVRQSTFTNTSDVFDVHRVIVDVELPPIQISLNSESDSGFSSSDRVTNATSLKFTVSGVRTGASVELLAGSQVVATSTASGTSTQVTVANVSQLGEGTIAFIARRTVAGQSSTSTPLNVRLDRTAPVPLDTSMFPEKLVRDVPWEINLNHAEESQGLRYSIQNAPSGMTVNANTGLLQWTPSVSQVGSHTFVLALTDTAGNSRNHSPTTLQVIRPPTAVADTTYTLKNEPVLIDVLANDLDGGGTIDPASVVIVVAPISGQVERQADGRILFTPAPGFVGNATFRYRVSDEYPLISNDTAVTVRVLNSRWQNPVTALDVNNDERIAAIDALLVINYLNSSQSRDLPSTSVVPPPFLDVNGDERISAIDALLVINHLNQQSDGGEGEDSTNDDSQRIQLDLSWLYDEESVRHSVFPANSRTQQVDRNKLRAGPAFRLWRIASN